MTEFFKQIELFISSNPAIANISASVVAVFYVIKNMIPMFSKKKQEIVIQAQVTREETQEIINKAVAEQLEPIKQMLSVAYANSKLPTEVKIKLAEISEGTRKIGNSAQDVVKSVTENIIEKVTQTSAVAEDVISKLEKALK